MGSKAENREVKERISELQDRTVDITQSEQQKENILRKKNEENLWNLWDS